MHNKEQSSKWPSACAFIKRERERERDRERERANDMPTVFPDLLIKFWWELPPRLGNPFLVEDSTGHHSVLNLRSALLRNSHIRVGNDHDNVVPDSFC